MGVHTYNLNTWGVEAEVIQKQGQPGLFSEFQSNLDYRMKPCLNPTPKQSNYKTQVIISIFIWNTVFL